LATACSTKFGWCDLAQQVVRQNRKQARPETSRDRSRIRRTTIFDEEALKASTLVIENPDLSKSCSIC